ncbi:MAG: hypothetical protein GF398_11090 [Chitinivibrionales bacterium]|nr:hypothetical protein [Chitinivibrionales bacterium]
MPMTGNARLPVVGLITLAGLFGAGLFFLMKTRLERGDDYPPYSSLRSDPVGARVLHESLKHFGQLRVRRHYQDLTKLTGGGAKTHLVLGMYPHQLGRFPVKAADDLERRVSAGDRMVIGLVAEPVHSFIGILKKLGMDGLSDSLRVIDSNARARDTTLSKRLKEQAYLQYLQDRSTSLGKRLSISLGNARYLQKNFDPGADTLKAVPNAATGDDVYSELVWHSTIFFETDDSAWQVIYSIDTMPVVIEKRLGAGSIVLMSDSYLLSNEGLLKSRNPAFLAWLIGSPKKVVFHEAHHGVFRKTTIGTLFMKYRLHGFLIGLCIVFALFIWRQFMPLRLRSAAQEGLPPIQASENARNGLVSLLRRTRKSSDIVKVCVHEWAHTSPLGKAKGAAIHRRLRNESNTAVRTGEGQDPVLHYNHLYKTLQLYPNHDKEARLQ